MLISLSITDDGFKFIFKAFQKKKKGYLVILLKTFNILQDFP